MKNKIIGLMIAGLVLGGCGSSTTKKAEVTPTPTVVVEKIDGTEIQPIEGGAQIIINSKTKISAIEFKVMADNSLKIISFIPNRSVFDSVLSNSGSNAGVSVSMAAMKATADLPDGKIVLGKILVRPGNGKLIVKEMKMVTPGSDGNPKQVLVNDFELTTEIK